MPKRKCRLYQMKSTLRNIVFSKLKWWHLLSRLVPTVLVTVLLFILVIPLIFWSIYGEGAVGDRLMDLPLNRFIREWSVLIVSELFLCILLWKNIYKSNLSEAKSYLIISSIILFLYIFRMPIAQFMFSICQ